MMDLILSAVSALAGALLILTKEHGSTSSTWMHESASLIQSGASASRAIAYSKSAPRELVSKVLRGRPPSELKIRDPSVRISIRLSESSRQAPKEALPVFGELLADFETEKMKIVQTAGALQQRGAIMSFVLGAISPILSKLGPTLIPLNSGSSAHGAQLFSALMVIAAASGGVDLSPRMKASFLLFLISEMLMSLYIVGFITP
ncbi:MAG: hypothetical protein JRN68_04130 [Nitrososphaerota archaeon]|jgi:hypothetical protein|nr:hypothetical protein [Nitrososphaerota archaeon]